MIKINSWLLLIIIFLSLIISINIDIENIVILIVIKCVPFLLIYGWFLSVGININHNIEEYGESDILFIISGIYLIIYSFFSTIFNVVESFALNPIIGLLLIIINTFSYFYVVYFVSKSYIKIEMNKYGKNSFKEATIFILFFIFPFGIVLLQPRIKEMIK